jgi:hypothetical protein
MIPEPSGKDLLLCIPLLVCSFLIFACFLVGNHVAIGSSNDHPHQFHEPGAKLVDFTQKKGNDLAIVNQVPPVTLSHDKFGIDKVYPTKKGGQEWYMNMANPSSDGRFNPQAQISKNADGSWKMKSDKVRMYVYSSNGYQPVRITSNNALSEVASRGYMGTPADWRDVEITGYVRLNSFTDNDNFVWYARGGKHSDTDHCQGSAYKGNLFYLGQTQFSKEQWHVAYVKSPTVQAIGPLKGKWTGFKFIMYSFTAPNGKIGVKLENWVDNDADGKNWENVYEGADVGKWGRSGNFCNVLPDQIISWGGPIASYRWDFASDVDFKDLSVREINGSRGVVRDITYFTGTDKSSHVSNLQSLSNPSTGLIRGENQTIQTSSRMLNLAGKGTLPNSMFSNGTTENLDSAQLQKANDESGTFDQQTIVQGNNTYVIWVSGDEDNTDLFFKVSHDNGVSFSKPINLSHNPASLSYHPKFLTIGNYVYIVWEDDNGNSGNTDIFFVESSDGGITFSGKKNISNDPAASGHPKLAVSGNNVYVVWAGESQDDTDISLAMSTNNGTSFGQPTNISNDPQISFDPTISLNNGNLTLTWFETGKDGKLISKIKSLSSLHLNSKPLLKENMNSTDFTTGNYTITQPVSLSSPESNFTLIGSDNLTTSKENSLSRENNSTSTPTLILDGESLRTDNSTLKNTTNSISDSLNEEVQKSLKNLQESTSVLITNTSLRTVASENKSDDRSIPSRANQLSTDELVSVNGLGNDNDLPRIKKIESEDLDLKNMSSSALKSKDYITVTNDLNKNSKGAPVEEQDNFGLTESESPSKSVGEPLPLGRDKNNDESLGFLKHHDIKVADSDQGTSQSGSGQQQLDQSAKSQNNQIKLQNRKLEPSQDRPSVIKDEKIGNSKQSGIQKSSAQHMEGQKQKLQNQDSTRSRKIQKLTEEGSRIGKTVKDLKDQLKSINEKLETAKLRLKDAQGTENAKDTANNLEEIHKLQKETKSVKKDLDNYNQKYSTLQTKKLAVIKGHS